MIIKNILKGFSLIELIVVIAIVAIIASIAVPAYKSYVTRAKLLNAVVIANTIIDRSIAYSATHSRFGSAYDLGLGTATYNQPYYGPINEPTEIQLFGQYHMPYGEIADTMLGEDWNATQPCGSSGTFYFHVNKPSIGLSDDGSSFFIYCKYWHTADNTFKRACGYANAGTADYLPGVWVNMDVSGWISDNGEAVCQQ